MKNLVKVALFTFTAMSIQLGYSQEAPRFEKRMKLYVNGGYQSWTRSFEFGRITPAFQWFNQKGNFHELELTQLNFARRKDQWIPQPRGMNPLFATSSTLDLSFRYEYGIQLLKKRDLGRFSLYAGLALNPRYGFIDMVSKNSSSFPYNNHMLGLSAQIVPRISYKITDRLSLDLNIPITFADFWVSRSSMGNPTQPDTRLRNTQTNFSTPNDRFLFRIGLTYRF